MKIIIPNYRVPDSFSDNVADTLVDMGHDVVTMPNYHKITENNISKLLREFAHRAVPSLLTQQERWLLDTVKCFKPDIVLGITQQIKEEVLFEVKKISPGTRRAVWWGDAPANLRGMGLLTNEWDYIFAKDENMVKKMKLIGLNTHLMHEAMNPKWHRPIVCNNDNSISIIGTYYGYRQILISRMIELNLPLNLYGYKPPRWAKRDIKVNYSGIYLIKNEKSEVFSKSLINLNSMNLTEGNSLNCRAFEIAGAGGFQLIEDRQAIENCFEPGKELICYSSLDDIVETFHRAKREPDWWRSIREAGFKRAKLEHTYAIRLDKIIKMLK